MIRILGAVLLTVGAAAIGFSAAGRLARRAKSLQKLLSALEYMDQELSFRLTPMPELLDRLARQSDPPVSAFFAHCSGGMEHLGEHSLSELWRAALKAFPMDLAEDDLQTLKELGEVLGRYDGEGQRSVLAHCRSRLEHNLSQAEADSMRLGRVYGALGLTAGAFLVILLL